MSHPVMPVPVRLDSKGGQFTFRSGTMVARRFGDAVPVVEGLCLDIGRCTELALGRDGKRNAGHLGQNEKGRHRILILAGFT